MNLNTIHQAVEKNLQIVMAAKRLSIHFGLTQVTRSTMNQQLH